MQIDLSKYHPKLKEAEININKFYLWLDMDSYFASIELNNFPKFRNKAFGVVRIKDYSENKIYFGNKGVIIAINYIAKKSGVKSEMSVFKAKQKCKEIVLVTENYDKYEETSKKILDICRKYNKYTVMKFIDEFYLTADSYDNAEKLALELKKNIKDELNLVASIGISWTELLSKMASKLDKPDGLTIIKNFNDLKRFDDLPIEEFYGVGERYEKRLNDIGIYKINDIKYNLENLVKEFNKKGARLFCQSLGLDEFTYLVYDKIIGQMNLFW